MIKKRVMKDTSELLTRCTYYPVDLTKLTGADKEALVEKHALDTDVGRLFLSGSDINRYGITTEAVDWGYCEFDSVRLENELRSWIRDYPHYLVFAYNCRWDGSSGYKFADRLSDTVARSYEIAICPDHEIRKGVACIEYSHDVPQGAMTYIIGLTEREFTRLSNADFDTVETFATSCGTKMQEAV